MNLDEYMLFKTLSKLKDKIQFLNNIVFSEDENDGLEYLLNFQKLDSAYDEDEDEDDDHPLFFTFNPEDDIEEEEFEHSFPVIKDIQDFEASTEEDYIAIKLYNIINSKSLFHIDLNDFKDVNVLILGDILYVNYEKEEHLKEFKLKKLLYNNVIIQTNYNTLIPDYVRDYLPLDNIAVFKVVGLLDTDISLS